MSCLSRRTAVAVTRTPGLLPHSLHPPHLSSLPSLHHSSFGLRSFSLSSDRLRPPAVYHPLPPPTLSRKTLRRQSLARASPHYMSHEEFQRCRRPFPAPVVTKLPLTHRALSPHSLLQQLQREEQARLMRDYPSHRDDFRTGDRICITKYVSLSDRAKVERVFGLVIARHGGRGLNAMFTVRNVKLEEAFELQFPLWSPFIVRIDLLERAAGGHERAKMYWVRDRDRKEWETHLTETLPKTAEQRRTLLKGSPMYLAQEKRGLDNKKRAKDDAKAAALGAAAAAPPTTAAQEQAHGGKPRGQ